MNHRTIATVLTTIALATAAAGVLGIVVLATPGRGDVPMTSAPSRHSALSPTPVPTGSAPPAAEALPLSDVASLPVHVTVRHGDMTLIDTDVVPITIDRDGVLTPPSGDAGVYFSPQDWNTIPGNLDAYRGIIAGHDVTGSGTKDVFYDLGQVRKGDRIVLTYAPDSETATAVFEVVADAVSAPKTDVIHSEQYQYLWQPMSLPGRYMSLLSCDLSQAEPGQHSRNNWIVDAVRIAQ